MKDKEEERRVNKKENENERWGRKVRIGKVFERGI